MWFPMAALVKYVVTGITPLKLSPTTHFLMPGLLITVNVEHIIVVALIAHTDSQPLGMGTADIV